MKVEYHPSTTTDLNEAIEYYDTQEPGLGDRCRAEVYAAIDRIVGAPQRYPVITGNIRRCFVNRFPFSVLYRYFENDGRVRILVIRHHRRRPSFGLRRR